MHRPWFGLGTVKPWDRKVTVVIPHLDTSELLDTVTQLHRLQTVTPNILIVDTGSSPRHLGVLEDIERAFEDVEVHRLRFKAVKHPSDPVAVAMDLAFSLCTTEYMFATHADCLPMRRDLLEWFIALAEGPDDGVPVVGYQITDRAGIETEGWVGHTATLFHMPTVDRLGLGWSQRRLCNLTGMSHFGNEMCSGYPDTEFLLNTQLDTLGLPRLIVGKEVNYETTKDHNITHVRSYASAKLYSPTHFEKARIDMAEAMTLAHERLPQWKAEHELTLG